MTLEGLTAIAEELDVSRKRVKGFVRTGAPIVVLSKGRGRRYFAELKELRLWWAAHKGNPGQSTA